MENSMLTFQQVCELLARKTADHTHPPLCADAHEVPFTDLDSYYDNLQKWYKKNRINAIVEELGRLTTELKELIESE